ncbi:MAG: MFS transporter [Brevundimonas sp.]|uniref:MFS transporter n=1 Tax=Brevundimonas sp. TaxID=1871086 RepID=UPI002717A968|nr:MFS transporter [Brevundimonas sp.]MDO9589310.1 MFS transporter [Brevundimonas sp.]MDP3369498.1 MFS transporter [Brevundimonas sp.]MDZ4108966.1 MFS transporter [Brevundimonas sp.]
MNLRSPAFAILFSVSLIAAAGNMALQSVLPAIGREFQLSDTLVAGAFAISALMWTVASPFWARLSDRLGRKRVMMIGLGGFVISMSGFGLAATSGLEQWLGAGLAFVLMAVARTVYGVFGSAAPIASQAYVADRTTPVQRTQAMSLLASAQGLGTVVGPALAPFFVLPLIGLAGPMYAFALFGAAALIVVWRKLPSGEVARVPSPSGHRGDAGKGLWKDPRVRGYLLYGLFVTGAQAANISVLGFHIIDELAETGIAVREAQPFIGIAMLAGAAATLMAQWGLIPLLKLQPADLMRWGAALALVGNLMSIAAPGYYGVVVGYAVVSMGVGFARPGFTAGSSLSVGPHEQGAIAGLMMSLAGLSFLGPPVIGVALYELAEPAPFIANAVLLAAATALCLLNPRLRAGPPDLPDRDETPSPETPPASQPGPEGNR